MALRGVLPGGRELRRAVRRLRREPALAVTAVATLAVAVAATTVMFGAVEAVLLRPLPYGDPDRLVLLWHRTAEDGAQRFRIPAPDVAEYRRRARGFDGFAFYDGTLDAALEGAGPREHVSVGVVTPDFFSVLGVEPAPGRGFRADESVLSPEALEDPELAPPPGVLVLSHELWRTRFGRDSTLLGSQVRLNGAPYTVVGIAPPGFELELPPGAGLPSRPDAWTPLRIPLDRMERDRGEWQDQDSDNSGVVVARLSGGTTLAEARAELARIAERQRETVPRYASIGIRIEAVPMREDVVRHARATLLALLAAVTCVLLVAALDVAALLLVRGTARREELRVRAALGADRLDLLGHLLSESLVLGAAAAALGLVLARLGVGLLRELAPAAVLPRIEAVGLDGTVLAVGVGLAVAATALSGLLPARAVLRDPRGPGGLRAGTGAASGRRRLGRGILVLQVALSVVLLVGAGLMVRTLGRLHDVRPGFEPAGLLTFRMTLPPGTIGGPAERARLVDGVVGRLEAVAGVEAVGVVGGLPLGGEVWSQPYGREGEAPGEWVREADFRVVTSRYFDAMGTRLLAGRAFTEREDLVEERRVVVVDASLARRLAPDGKAVGMRIGFPLDGDPVWAEVVGVVEPVRYESLREHRRPTIYVPYRQEASRAVGFAVRAAGAPEEVAGRVRAALAERLSDVTAPTFDFRSMEEYLAREVAPTRFAMALLSAFAATALLLACVGLYGGLSYAVRLRDAEIGVRMAVGASPGRILRRFLGEGLWIAGAGLGLGLLVSLALSGTVEGLVYGVEPWDPVTYGAVAATLLLAAGAASIVPARRASAVEPVTVLKGR